MNNSISHLVANRMALVHILYHQLGPMGAPRHSKLYWLFCDITVPAAWRKIKAFRLGFQGVKGKGIDKDVSARHLVRRNILKQIIITFFADKRVPVFFQQQDCIKVFPWTTA